MVSKLNPAQRSVTVEWYERGETKGKEVELDMLLALNPELIQNKTSFVAPPPQTATAPINLQRVSIKRAKGFVFSILVQSLAMRHQKKFWRRRNIVQAINEVSTAKASFS